MGSDLIIKKLSISHAVDVVEIHSRAMPDDVLPCFGHKFLCGYYRRVLHETNAELFGVIYFDKVIGFCLVSSTSSGLMNIILSKQGIFQLGKLILTKPKFFILGLIQALKRSKCSENSAEILFLAVDPRYQKKGFGSALLSHVNKWCKHNGFLFLQTKTSNQLLQNYYLNKFEAVLTKRYNLFGRNYFELKWSTSIRAENSCVD